jgi:hypothetical protein
LVALLLPTPVGGILALPLLAAVLVLLLIQLLAQVVLAPPTAAARVLLERALAPVPTPLPVAVHPGERVRGESAGKSQVAADITRRSWEP